MSAISALCLLMENGYSQADSLQNRADALLARADTIDGLIQSTQLELSEKRKEFEHYKNRAQTEMAISLQVHTRGHGGRVAACGHLAVRSSLIVTELLRDRHRRPQPKGTALQARITKVGVGFERRRLANYAPFLERIALSPSSLIWCGRRRIRRLCCGSRRGRLGSRRRSWLIRPADCGP